MKTIFARLFTTACVASLLSACGTNPALMNRAAVGSFAAPKNQQQAIPRSNAGLDVIARRMRTILFNHADANHDGILHRHEIPNVPAELYTAADKNKDGMWNVAEFLTFNFDATSLQVPSRELLRNMAKQSWALYNKDNNAFVTLDEVLTAMTPSAPTQPPTCPPSPDFKCPAPDPNNGGGAVNQAELLSKATVLFNSADKNLDRKLNMSEFEDMNAKGLLDGMEAPHSHPAPAPSAHPPCDGGTCPAPRR